jgi:hypothetical protein
LLCCSPICGCHAGGDLIVGLRFFDCEDHNLSETLSPITPR